MTSSEPEAGTAFNPFLSPEATEAQLEKFLLLGLFVAGKNASVQQRKLDWFCRTVEAAMPKVPDAGPLTRIRSYRGGHGHGRCVLPFVDAILRYGGVGQYGLMMRAIDWLTSEPRDLREITRDELAECPKVSYKTASFFLLYSRPDERLACLDTHLLRYMNNHRLTDNIPLQTPPPRRYVQLERVWLNHCDELGRNPAKLDFEIWSTYRQGGGTTIDNQRTGASAPGNTALGQAVSMEGGRSPIPSRTGAGDQPATRRRPRVARDGDQPNLDGGQPRVVAKASKTSSQEVAQ